MKKMTKMSSHGDKTAEAHVRTFCADYSAKFWK